MMEPIQEDDSYLDSNVPGFVENGDRFDVPIRRRMWGKGVRSVAAVVLASMLFAAGTPISWVTVVTAICDSTEMSGTIVIVLVIIAKTTTIEIITITIIGTIQFRKTIFGTIEIIPIRVTHTTYGVIGNINGTYTL